ncbi:MAG TPA: hypothetical protein VGD91_02505 [Trebonia sp.]
MGSFPDPGAFPDTTQVPGTRQATGASEAWGTQGLGASQFRTAPALPGQPPPGFDQRFGPGGPGAPGGPAVRRHITDAFTRLTARAPQSAAPVPQDAPTRLDNAVGQYGNPGQHGAPGQYGPPSQYGAPSQYGPPSQYGAAQYSAGQNGGGTQGSAVAHPGPAGLAGGPVPFAGGNGAGPLAGKNAAGKNTQTRNRALVVGAGVLAAVAVAGVVAAPKLFGPSDPGCTSYSGPALTAYNKTISDLNREASQAVLTKDMSATITELDASIAKAQSTSVKSALDGLLAQLKSVQTHIESGSVPAATVNALNAAATTADNAC